MGVALRDNPVDRRSDGVGGQAFIAFDRSERLPLLHLIADRDVNRFEDAGVARINAANSFRIGRYPTIHRDRLANGCGACHFRLQPERFSQIRLDPGSTFKTVVLPTVSGVAMTGLDHNDKRVWLVNHAIATQEIVLRTKADLISYAAQPGKGNVQLNVLRVNRCSLAGYPNAIFRWHTRFDYGQFKAEVAIGEQPPTVRPLRRLHLARPAMFVLVLLGNAAAYARQRNRQQSNRTPMEQRRERGLPLRVSAAAPAAKTQ